MKIYKEFEQQTPEWFAKKKGVISGKSSHKVMSSRQSTKDDIFYKILGERLCVGSNFPNESATERGNRLEPEARDYYSKRTGLLVEEVGFVEKDDHQYIGYSPDGIIKTESGLYTKGIEIKCFELQNHVKAWVTNEISEELKCQIIQAFICNEQLEVMDCVFYCPEIEIQPMHVISFTRNQLLYEIAKQEYAEIEFNDKVNSTLKKILLTN